MTFDELLKKSAEKHNGVHKKVVAEVTAAVWADEALLKVVVDRYVEQAVCGVCYRDATNDRRRAKDAATRGKPTVKPRFGDDREIIIQRQNESDARWLESLKYHRLFGGLYLYKATRSDVEASIQHHRDHLEKHTAGVMNTIRFEESILSLARGKRKENIADVLVPGNADALKRLVSPSG